MDQIEPNRPFRWNVARGDRLGSLVGDGSEEYDPGYVAELTECAAKVVARSADGDLFFVGRSPDSLYDLLGGVLAGTADAERLNRLPLSLYGYEGRVTTPQERRQLRVNLADAGLSPAGLAGRRRPVVLVDLVAAGSTFGNLHRELRDWIDDERAAWNVIRTKVRYLGVTARGKTSPKTWRWQQHADWVGELPARAVRNVSVSGWLWGYLGNSQPKAEHSFRRHRWADPGVTVPRRDEEARAALNSAVVLHGYGRTPEARERFRRVLAGEPGFREPWLRALAGRVRAA
ncbi:hypothetical protein [Nocardiopsis sp. CA-288880]|uniref:hypothetical protein n=1 Tax=Nocardiopsis sp. CA-288880 TaxID=3239995 RepID=UPI003D974F18